VCVWGGGVSRKQAQCLGYNLQQLKGCRFPLSRAACRLVTHQHNTVICQMSSLTLFLLYLHVCPATPCLIPYFTDHRYQYPISDTPIAIMPTLDYYGYEHEDAITGTAMDCVRPMNICMGTLLSCHGCATQGMEMKCSQPFLMHTAPKALTDIGLCLNDVTN